MAKISAFIIAKNEEARIARAINSLKEISEEIIVIDSGSTDNTVGISKDLGARVVFNEWSGYVNQKIFGESLCKNDWIINLDADEELTKELQEEIALLFKTGKQDEYKAYDMNMIIMHRNDSKPRLFAPNNYFIRLYNKNYIGFFNTSGYTTHDVVSWSSGYGSDTDFTKLKAPALHYSGASIEQLVAKANFYSSEQAKDMLASGRKISSIRVISEFFFWLIKAFFIRRYFVFGFDGFVDSMIFSFARFLRLSKARELQRKGEK